jgi:hypothetical protein
MPETKRCSRCKQELPLDRFNRRTTNRYSDNGALHHRIGDPQPYCKTCDTEYARERRLRMRQARQLRREYDAQAWSNGSA